MLIASIWGRDMFLTDSVCAMHFAAPCVNKMVTPAGPVPVPLFNISMSCSALPNILNIFSQGLPMQNLLSMGALSTGSEPCAPLGGLMSQRFDGSARNLLGSFKVFTGGAPVKRFLDPTGQNGIIPNSFGLTISISNFFRMVMT
jgi:hypothetical protein